MKQILLGCISMVVVCLMLGCAPQGQSEEGMLAAAQALDNKFVAAYNAGDAEALLSTYWNSPDLVSFPPGEMETRGWEAVKEGMTKELAEMSGGTLELTESHNMVAGDVVIGWGKWRFTVPGENGEAMEMVGRYSDVKAERDGNWVYIMDHVSAPMPPPDMEGMDEM